ncbi:hypothetical protein PoB_005321900 [Plakobranchus ocellatus]|uniref:Uncharacterized protein n=1 Tax=Plakobranchus ocellatus TaxID=259542 RepID=A0AAV4C7N1_9GAST|nr:hypothetical protein PoB_005321900 [Plakobranchus ocellatus]
MSHSPGLPSHPAVMPVDVEVSLLNASFVNMSTTYDNFSYYADFYDMYDFYRKSDKIPLLVSAVTISTRRSQFKVKLFPFTSKTAGFHGAEAKLIPTV